MKLQIKDRRSQITNIPFAGIKNYFNAGSISYSAIYDSSFKILIMFLGDGMLLPQLKCKARIKSPCF